MTCEADQPVQAALDAALSGVNAAIVPVELPGLAEAFAANIAIIGAETWAAFGYLTQSDAMGADVKARLLNASKVSQTQQDEAEAVRQTFRAEVDAALAEVDALVLPTMPLFPLTLADAADAAASLRMTALVRPFNLSGHPALSIPIEAPNGLPVGVQLVGRIGGDEALCAVARVLAEPLGANPRLFLQEHMHAC